MFAFRNGISLTTRLLWLGPLPAMLLLIVLGSLLYNRLSESLHGGLVQRLEERADALQADFLLTPNGQWKYQDGSRDGEFTQIFSGWYWVLQPLPPTPAAQSGQPQSTSAAAISQNTLYSRSLWDGSLSGPPRPARAGLFSQIDPRGRALLGIARPISIDGPAGPRHALLHIYTLAEPLHDNLARIRRSLWLALLLFLLGLAASTWLQLRVGLRPLQQLQQRLSHMHDASQAELERLGQGYGPELDPLAQEIDALLERNARMLARGRTYAADLSHAIKTPLARLSAQASAQPNLPSALVLEQVHSIHGLIERHMSRTSNASDSAPGLLQRIAVLEVVQALVQLMQHIHAERALQWQVDADALAHTLRWRGEQSDLEEMLGNLLDNAGKWARSQVRVHLELQAPPTPGARPTLCIGIADDGPGIADENLALAGQRGQRFDERTPGSGLGLSLAAEIAHSWGGALELGRSAELGGLQARLRLPTS